MTAALASGDEVRAELARQVEAAGGVVAWSRRADLSHTAVSFAHSGERPITERVANALGYTQVTAYVRVGRGVA